MNSDPWDLPVPHVVSFEIAETDIDDYQHVNNAVYMTWFDRAAWDHSAQLGLPIAACLALDCGMAVVRSVIAYRRAALRGDRIEVATWLVPGTGSLRIGRRFQVRRAGDATLARAAIEYACIALKSGRPARWPEAFVRSYVPAPQVVEALPTLAAL